MLAFSKVGHAKVRAAHRPQILGTVKALLGTRHASLWPAGELDANRILLKGDLK